MDSINKNETIELDDLEPHNDVKGGGVNGAGVLTLNGNTPVSQSSTGIRRLDGFVVTFDRPIDP